MPCVACDSTQNENLLVVTFGGTAADISTSTSPVLDSERRSRRWSSESKRSVSPPEEIDPFVTVNVSGGASAIPAVVVASGPEGAASTNPSRIAQTVVFANWTHGGGLSRATCSGNRRRIDHASDGHSFGMFRCAHDGRPLSDTKRDFLAAKSKTTLRGVRLCNK